MYLTLHDNYHTEYDMPKLLLNRIASKSSAKYGPPHSPFQKLIHGALKANGYSETGFAKEKLDVNPGSFWIWLHNKNGFPHPRSCKAHHLEALSEHLHIPLPTIHQALDASRHLFTPRERSLPVETKDGLKMLIDILQNDRRTKLMRSYVLNLARKLMAGGSEVA
jgi:hypothetical protein